MCVALLSRMDQSLEQYVGKNVGAPQDARLKHIETPFSHSYFSLEALRFKGKRSRSVGEDQDRCQVGAQNGWRARARATD